jgi:Zn-dependent protease with chaperone function
MRPALLVFCYALAVAWYAPALLTRLTAHGIGARLGLAAWLAAMASVLVTLVVAVGFLVRAAVGGWPRLAAVVCRSVAGGACTPTLYRSALFEGALALAAIAASLAGAVLAWRYGHGIQRSRRRTRAHVEIARMAGNRLPGIAAAVVLDVPQPAAYCVAGRPATIVLTSGALALLDPAQLTAVLAHERAHLAGRHHALIAITRGLAASLPAVPLLRLGQAEVARLAEMCADDAAAQHSGRGTLIAALLAMSTGAPVTPVAPVPAAALAATTCATAARVQRLMDPPRRVRRAGYGLALAAVTLLLPLAAAGVIAIAGPLTAHGLTGLLG